MKTSNIALTGIFFMIINLAIYAGLFCGGVYFVLWALKHFGIIA